VSDIGYTMTTVPKKITLSYTLKVPVTFDEFVRFLNKERTQENQLTTESDTAEDIWTSFITMMKALKNKIPSGAHVSINEEDHEAVYSLKDVIQAVVEEEETDEENEG